MENKAKQQVKFLDLGRVEYQQAWDFQTALHRELMDNKLKNRHLRAGTYPQKHHLLFCEHPPVYTLGRSGSMQNLLLDEAQLDEKGIRFFPINRGGDITFHGLGQIVGYPILDLECFYTDVHRYVREIEEVIIRTIADYGLEGFRIKEYTGVWVKSGVNFRKICAIGVHLSRWTTLHGWAFNVATELDYFKNIVPCGIVDPNKSVTTLEIELGQKVDVQEVKSKIKSHFESVFNCELLPEPSFQLQQNLTS